MWHKRRGKLRWSQVRLTGELRAFAEADEMIPPRDELARRIEAALEVHESRRTICVMMHVVFARPQQLHWAADDFRHPRRFKGVVVRQPPAEATARFHDVPGDVAFLDAERPRHSGASGR